MGPGSQIPTQGGPTLAKHITLHFTHSLSGNEQQYPTAKNVTTITVDGTNAGSAGKAEATSDAMRVASSFDGGVDRRTGAKEAQPKV